jgi:hypothetical protein
MICFVVPPALALYKLSSETFQVLPGFHPRFPQGCRERDYLANLLGSGVRFGGEVVGDDVLGFDFEV